MDLLFAALVFLVAVPAHGSSSYCFAPTVEAGNTATVTCYFDRDVSGSQFMVRRQCGRQRAETVLDCYEKSGNTPYCEKLDEITYDWKPGKDQTLSIANVTKDSEGKYVCQLEESAEESQPCHLNVTEPAKIIDDSQQIPTEDEDKQQEESKPGHKDTIVAGIVVAAVVISAVTVAVAVAVARAVVLNILKRYFCPTFTGMEHDKDARNGKMGNKEENTSLRVEDETKPMEPTSAFSSSASTTSSNAPEPKSLMKKAPAHSITV